VRDDTEGYLAHKQLESLAATDPLTGLANRRRFSDALDKEWQRAARDGRPLSLLFVDADRFKAFNDTYGHQAGDRCLKAIADTLSGALRRPADLAARYGGEEFVLLLPSTDSAGARHLAEAIRVGVEALAMPRGRTPGDGVLTVSIGVATERPGAQMRKPEGLVAQADHALYAAKAAGRNRVWVDGEAVEPTDIDWSFGAVDEVEMPPPRRGTG
jgi:diguanylate cyclase (GGDEF)-like protein